MKENETKIEEKFVATTIEEEATHLVLEDGESVSTITINAPTDHASVGETIQLTTSIASAASTASTWSTRDTSDITWTSSNPAVATVNDNGEVVINGVGQSIITAKTSNGDVAIMAVSGDLDDGVYILENVGSHKYATVSATQVFDQTDVHQLTGSSSDEAQWWKIKRVGDGKYSIRTYLNTRMGLSITSNSSMPVAITSIGQVDSSCCLSASACWTITSEGSNFTLKNCSNGMALAIAAGNTNDCAKLQTLAYNSSSANTNQRWYCTKITSVPEAVVVLDKDQNEYLTSGVTLTMNIGEYRNLRVAYKSATSIDQSLTWTSSNGSIAMPSADDGFCAFSSGTATITATSKANTRKSFSFKVSVRADSDYDGINNSDDNTNTSGVFSGTLASYDSNGNVKYSVNNAQYRVDYRDFAQDPTVFNTQLCQLSAVVSTIIYDRRKFNNLDIDDWMAKHGMSGDVGGSYRMNITGSDDHLSEIALGYRPVVYGGKKRLVIAVIIRGTNGTIQEWSSNMDIGNTNTYHMEWTNVNNHMGFDITALRILYKVRAFAAKIKSRFSGFELTYWVTGHSRGGALANLVAAKLIDDGNLVFAYTFAAPATTVYAESIAHAAKYNSIFNIVNTDDFIPYFPVSTPWGFKRYGRTTSVSVATNCKSDWENIVGEDYKWMNSPTAPLSKLACQAVAPNRNSCYRYERSSDGYVVMSNSDGYPSNTEGYYELNGNKKYQSPMFLMKYFAAVATDEDDPEHKTGGDFFGLNVAPYLEDAKSEFLKQVTGVDDNALSGVNINTKRVAYPHMPESYYLLSKIVKF